MALSIGVIIYNLFANYRQKEYLKKYEIFKNGVTAYLGGNLSKDALHELVLENQEYLIELLAQLTQATSKANRHQLIDLLVACESTSVIDKELHQLQFGNWHERLNAATYLPFIAHAKTIEKPLLASLEDEFLDVRIAAANSLAQLGVIEAIHPILAHLAIEGAWPVQRLIEILSQFDIHAIPHLKSYITEPQASQPGRQIAIAVLGLIKDEASVSFLVSLCTDGDVDIRVWLYRSLGQLGYTSALPQLLMGMEDIAWEVRATCAKSLKHFEGEQSISALQKGISDPVWFVRLNCATSLIAMGMPGRLALEKLHDSPDHFVRDMSQMVLSQNINKEML
jgi:HEAT repeat protein